MRNSSLVERPCAEDVRGSSTEPKSRQDYIILGRGSVVYPTEGVPEGALEDIQERMPV